MLLSLCSLSFPLPIGGRGRKTCFFYRSSKKILFNYQKTKRQRRKEVWHCKTTQYFTYFLQYHIGRSTVLTTGTTPIQEGIIGFKQRILYISKSTKNVCWKNNYRMKIETLLPWIEKGEEYKRHRKSVKESWDKPHRESLQPRKRQSLFVAAYLDQTLEMALCPKFCVTELCSISLKQGPNQLQS